MKNDEAEREKQWNMMKKREKNNETWLKKNRETKTMKNEK